MKLFLLLALVAAASATTLLRAPAHDSAIIQSHRFGGNFAYRTDEAHAYAAINPIIGTVRRPVGVSYHQGAPIVRSTSIHAGPAVASVRAAPLAAGYGYAAGLGYRTGLGYGAGLYGHY